MYCDDGDENQCDSDRLLVTAISDAIRCRCPAPLRVVRITVHEGTVSVEGVVGSFYEKQLILHAARNVPGIRAIVDEVSVTLDMGH